MLDKLPDWVWGVLFFGILLPGAVMLISGAFAFLGYAFVPQGGTHLL